MGKRQLPVRADERYTESHGFQRFRTRKASTMTQSTDIEKMLKVVQNFHEKHGFDVGTKDRETMIYRMNLLMEEVGEISECLTKDKGNLSEEHADLLILLLGNSLIMDIDITEAFWNKMEEIKNRSGKQIGQQNRVSRWEEE